jgi:polyhydroxyalkanoate synthesis regulator phasin
MEREYIVAREEMTRQEAKEVELEDFLKELVDIISRKFDVQKADIADLQRSVDAIKEDDIIELRRSMYEIKEKITELSERVTELAEKERKISRDILGAIIE